MQVIAIYYFCGDFLKNKGRQDWSNVKMTLSVIVMLAFGKKKTLQFMAFQKSRSSPNVINLKKTNYFKFFYINFTFISSIFHKK